MKIIILILCLAYCLSTYAQTENSPQSLDFQFILGIGTGAAKHFEKSDLGIGGMVAIELVKNKYVASIGYRSVGEFQFLGVDLPSHQSSNLDALIGRKIQLDKIDISLQSGISLVNHVLRGAFISSDPGLFGTSFYDKIKINNLLGLPLSAKLSTPIKRNTDLCLELYGNLNKFTNFCAINLCLRVKDNPFRKKKAS